MSLVTIVDLSIQGTCLKYHTHVFPDLIQGTFCSYLFLGEFQDLQSPISVICMLGVNFCLCFLDVLLGVGTCAHVLNVRMSWYEVETSVPCAEPQLLRRFGLIS